MLRKLKELFVRKKNERLYRATDHDYDATTYWKDRHERYQYQSLQGVGRSDQSDQENKAWYRSGEYIFRGLLNDLPLNPGNDRVIEFGYGTGFYTKIIHSLGVKNYLGVDIVDRHRDSLQNELAGFQGQLIRGDAGVDRIEYSESALIFAIDMTQHIVNEEKLRFFLQENVQKNLAKGGVFIVTDDLKNKKYSFYESSRSLLFYERALGLKVYQPPTFFRDKFIFSFKD